MSELDNWPGSIVGTMVLADAVGQFLRTHREGNRLLWDWLYSVPADRTEAEYQQECEQAVLEQDQAAERGFLHALRCSARLPEDAPFGYVNHETAAAPALLKEYGQARELRNCGRYVDIYCALRLPVPPPQAGDTARAYQLRLLVGIKGCGPWWPLDPQGFERLSAENLDGAEDDTLAGAERLIEAHRQALEDWRLKRAQWWRDYRARRVAPAVASVAPVGAPERVQ